MRAGYFIPYQSRLRGLLIKKNKKLRIPPCLVLAMRVEGGPPMPQWGLGRYCGERREAEHTPMLP